jgi:hypothetical protein
LANIEFVTRAQGRMLVANRMCAFDASSYAEHPFNKLSPFSFSKDYNIPVPGMTYRFSHSVEAVWQGLKIIEGKTDEQMFERKPRKRKGFVEGHSYFDKILDLASAREKIYFPCYTFYINNYAQDAVSLILDEQRKGNQVYVFDIESNRNISSPEPLAHASILAFLLNAKLNNRQYVPVNDAEKKLSKVLDSDSSIEDKVDVLTDMLNDSDIESAFRYRCIEHPQNPDDYAVGTHFSK